MKKYDPWDYMLCRATSNAMNFYIVEEIRGELREVIVDWDLSDEEEDALIEKFESGELDFHENGNDWVPEGEAYKGLWGRTPLA